MTGTLAAIAAGGALGAALRYGVGAAAGDRLWATLGINLVGCALIGVLMVLIVEVGVGPPLLRPFVGVGVLGGFTTFSAYALDVASLAGAGRVALAVAYLLVTVLGALTATWLGVAATRHLTRRYR